MQGPCIAYLDDGRVCRAPAPQLDVQRGGLVCAAHAPLPASRQQEDTTMIEYMQVPTCVRCVLLGHLTVATLRYRGMGLCAVCVAHLREADAAAGRPQEEVEVLP